MSAGQRYKARYSAKLPNGDFLNVVVWPGKSDPGAEIVQIQVRHPTGDSWETIGRIAIYRTPDGNYSLLPEKQAPAPPVKAGPVELEATGAGYE